MFKVDDRVIYTSGVHGDHKSNPLWGGAYGKVIGTITNIDARLVTSWIGISWDIGSFNVYRKGDIELYKRQTQLNLFRG